MTREQFIKKHGDTKTKMLAGILHIYLTDDHLESHYDLENQIILHGDKKIKDSIIYLDDLLEFEVK